MAVRSLKPAMTPVALALLGMTGIGLTMLGSTHAAPAVPQAQGPGWAAGLGMTDLESETKGRLDDAVARVHFDPAKAASLKAQVDALRTEEQGYRTARTFTPDQFNRINAALLQIAAQVPDTPPLHPPEAAPANLDWIEPSAPAPLDLTGYRLSFEDEFDRLDIAPDGGKARWYAPVHSDFGEAHFLPPGPAGPFQIVRSGPLGLGGASLAIKATHAPDGWRAGLMETLDSHGQGFSQQYGYFEMRARMPKGQGTWPGFWLLTRNGLVDPTVTRGEIDVVEQYGSSPEKIHTTVHLWPANARNAGGLPKHWYKSEKVAVGDMSSGYHRYGAMLTPQWVIIYYDGMEISRFPMLPQYKTPVYMLVNLTMHAKNLDRATNPSTLLVDYVRAYTKG